MSMATTIGNGYTGVDLKRLLMEQIDMQSREACREDFKNTTSYIELEKLVERSATEITRQFRQMMAGFRNANDAASRPHSTRRLDRK